MPPLVLLGFAGFALSRGALDVAALLLAGFARMLRSMEMFSICRNHVALAAQLTGAILLPDTKSGKRKGGLEIACLSDRLAGYWLGRAMLMVNLRDPILRRSIGGIFADACRALGMADQCYRLYSIRRGGAAFDYKEYGNLARTIFNGRRGSTKVARIYITEGAATVNEWQLSEATKRLLRSYASLLRMEC